MATRRKGKKVRTINLSKEASDRVNQLHQLTGLQIGKLVSEAILNSYPPRPDGK